MRSTLPFTALVAPATETPSCLEGMLAGTAPTAHKNRSGDRRCVLVISVGPRKGG